MGGTNSSKNTQEAFDPQNWLQIKPGRQCFNNISSSTAKMIHNNNFRSQKNNAAFQNYPKYLQNKLTGEQVSLYQIFFNDQDQLHQYINECKYRQANKLFLVAPKHIHIQNKSSLCTMSYVLNIYAENMALKLSDIKFVPIEDFTYILRATIEGFRLLYDRYGGFQIQSQLIYINSEGMIKVWVNPDFSKYWPTIQSLKKIYNKNPQSKMIDSLINIIENHVSWSNNSVKTSTYSFHSFSPQKKSYEKFSQYLSKKSSNVYTFQQAIQQLDNYILSMKIKTSKFVTSILKTIRASKGIYDSQILSDNRFQFKESNVFPFKIQNFRSVAERKASLIRSQSNQTYADRLDNNSRSGLTDINTLRHKQSTIFDSLLMNTKPIISQQILSPKVNTMHTVKDQVINKNIDKSNQGNIQYRTSRISEQNQQMYYSRHSQLSVHSKSKKQSLNASKLTITESPYNLGDEKVLKNTTDDLVSHLQNSEKLKIQFSYNNSSSKIQPFLTIKYQTLQEMEQHSIHNKQIEELKNEQIQSDKNKEIWDICRSPNAQTYTTQKDLQLDPQILADLQKYSSQL